MTRTDILLVAHHAHILIESGENKENLHEIINRFQQMLDTHWCNMIDINDTIKRTEGDNFIIKTLNLIKNNMAKAFNEPDYFNQRNTYDL
jgi:hypothetical protein